MLRAHNSFKYSQVQKDRLLNIYQSCQFYLLHFSSSFNNKHLSWIFNHSKIALLIILSFHYTFNTLNTISGIMNYNITYEDTPTRHRKLTSLSPLFSSFSTSLGRNPHIPSSSDSPLWLNPLANNWKIQDQNKPENTRLKYTGKYKFEI